MIELLTVEDHFDISNLGLIVLPDFSVPEGGWKPTKEEIEVKKPDGTKIKKEAIFLMEHRNIRDPKVSIDKRWRIVLTVPTGTKEEIPVGSRILVSNEFRNKLLH